MTRPSPELAAIAERWVKAMVSQNGQTMVNMLSTGEPLIFCGTAENEIYRDAFFRKNYASHVAEIPLGQLEDVKIEAFESGDMGWAFWHGSIRFPNSTHIGHARITLIFQLEAGLWKVQHIHNSFPVANVESWGYEHSALDDLLHATETADPLVGTTGISAVMFTDIADSSLLASIVGDAAWTRQVNRHMQMVAASIEAEGGRLIKSLGDGTMSTFSSARAAMTAACDVQRRLQAETQEPKLAVRIGIHTGDVVQAGNDFFGTVVNKAARVASVARAGEIRVSDATRIMVGETPDFRFDDEAKVPLKGFQGLHVIHRLIW